MKFRCATDCDVPMDLDLIFKALANPTRRQILEWLKSPEQYLSAEECGGFQRGVCAGQIERLGQVSVHHVQSPVGVTAGWPDYCDQAWTVVIFLPQ